MGKLLFRRMMRFLRQNAPRYLCLGLLTAVIVAIVVTLVGTSYTILNGHTSCRESERIEDGSFTLLFPLSEEKEAEIESLCGVTLSRTFYADLGGENETFVRLMSERTELDLLSLREGRKPQTDDEIAVDQLSADERGIGLGDTLLIEQKSYTVVGLGSIPDYVRPFREITDVSLHMQTFIWAIATRDGYEKILTETNKEETFQYAYELGENADFAKLREEIRNLDFDALAYCDSHPLFYAYVLDRLGYTDSQTLPNPTAIEEECRVLYRENCRFLRADDNPRMQTDVIYADIFLTAGYAVGAVFIALMLLIFSVLTSHQIREEAPIIGALSAQGVSRGLLKTFYILPATAVTFLGGVAGIFIGYSPICMDLSLEAFHIAYSFPYYAYSKPPILFLYALAVPTVLCVLIHSLVLHKTFSLPTLRLLRGDVDTVRTLPVKVRGMHFIHRFQMRQILRESLLSFLLMIGVMLSTILLMLGLNTEVMNDNACDITREYAPDRVTVFLRFPTQSLDTDGERIAVRDLQVALYGVDVTVNLIGVGENSRHFRFDLPQDSDRIVINQATASKWNLQVGDSLTLRDGTADEAYSFTVERIVSTTASLDCYLSMKSYHALFGQRENEYNAVVLDHAPDIDEDLILSQSDTDSIIDGLNWEHQSMNPFIYLSIIGSVLLYLVIVTLVLQVLIDRNARGISLTCVLGYSAREIRRMFFIPLMETVIVALLAAIPLAKIFADRLCRFVYAEVATGLFLSFPASWYFVIALSAVCSFEIILLCMAKKIKRMPFGIILKES